MKKLKKPKVFILDESKWRCGIASLREENVLGECDTYLYNPDKTLNNMCCLGQYCEQVGIAKKQIKHISTPERLGIKIPLLTKINTKLTPVCINTVFTDKCMNINDNPITTVSEKVEKLTKLFKSKGVELTFKRKSVESAHPITKGEL